MRQLFRLLAVLTTLLPASAWAQGGPPLMTDDPDTPGPGYWEINLSAFLERRVHAYVLEAPRLDANVGVGKQIQLKFEVPWIRASDANVVRSGAGNAVAGLKYRFVGQEGRLIAWSVYPQLEFNTAHASVTKGLVGDGREVLLPTELTLEISHVEINGEAGRRFVQNGVGGWIYGVSTEGHVMPRLELLAELHGERQIGESTDWIANVGAREKLTRQLTLMLAVGRGVRAAIGEPHPRLIFYTGVQLNLPGVYRFD